MSINRKAPDHVCGLMVCNWRGKLKDARTAPHPFKLGEIIHGCPVCGNIGCWVACDVKDCTAPGTSRALPNEPICDGPFLCDYHGGIE